MSLAPVKSRLVLPFWYRLTQVILEKRPLNGCCCCTFSTQLTQQRITDAGGREFHFRRDLYSQESTFPLVYRSFVDDAVLQAGQATEPECMIAVGLVASGSGQVVFMVLKSVESVVVL